MVSHPIICALLLLVTVVIYVLYELYRVDRDL